MTTEVTRIEEWMKSLGKVLTGSDSGRTYQTGGISTKTGLLYVMEALFHDCDKEIPEGERTSYAYEKFYN